MDFQLNCLSKMAHSLEKCIQVLEMEAFYSLSDENISKTFQESWLRRKEAGFVQLPSALVANFRWL